MKGTGEFWDVDEARPDDTVCKPAELRRVVGDSHLRLMGTGTSQEISELLRSVIEEW